MTLKVHLAVTSAGTTLSGVLATEQTDSTGRRSSLSNVVRRLRAPRNMAPRHRASPFPLDPSRFDSPWLEPEATGPVAAPTEPAPGAPKSVVVDLARADPGLSVVPFAPVTNRRDVFTDLDEVQQAEKYVETVVHEVQCLRAQSQAEIEAARAHADAIIAAADKEAAARLRAANAEADRVRRAAADALVKAEALADEWLREAEVERASILEAGLRGGSAPGSRRR